MSYKVRTFRAPSMPEALAAVKRELGPDAVILGTRTLPSSGLSGIGKRNRVEITAAPHNAASPAPRLRARAALLAQEERLPAVGRANTPDQATGGNGNGNGNGHAATLAAAVAERRARAISAVPAPAPAPSPAPPAAPAPSEPVLPEHLYRHYVQLVQNDVAEDLAERLIRAAAEDLPPGQRPDDDAIRAAVQAYIARMLPEHAAIELGEGQPRRVALVGPSGAGKSLTLAKLAALYRLRYERSVAFLSLDMHRMAAHEQLQRYADVLEVPLFAAQTIGEVRETLRALTETDLVLIDTPGVGLREQARFARLATLLRAARPDEVHLVLPASLATAVQNRVARGFAPLGANRIVLTRLDEVVGLGVILNVVESLNLGVSYISTGQNVPNDLEEACSDRLAELVLGRADESSRGEGVFIR